MSRNKCLKQLEKYLAACYDESELCADLLLLNDNDITEKFDAVLEFLVQETKEDLEKLLDLYPNIQQLIHTTRGEYEELENANWHSTNKLLSQLKLSEDEDED